MKATERHQLKQNEFAITTGKVVDSLQQNRSRIGVIVVAVAAILLIAGGFYYWRKQQADKAGAALGIAMATAESPIAPASSLPGVTQAAGTFPSERERSDAAITAFTDVSTQHAGTDAGTAATYHLAAELLRAGRTDEAEQNFRKVAESGSTLYAPLARLGIAETQSAAGKIDQAVATLTELAATRDGLLPPDAVLMELGRTQVKAGKPVEARAAFKRVVDEFPASTYLSDAQQQIDALE
jgi:predicted negative regulator of RcsB-dependent stress response